MGLAGAGGAHLIGRGRNAASGLRIVCLTGVGEGPVEGYRVARRSLCNGRVRE
jgi:hypothetical protein